MSIPRFRWVALGLLVAAAAPVLFAMDLSPGREQLWARFTHPVKFADLLLPEGNYLIVHDDDDLPRPCLRRRLAEDCFDFGGGEVGFVGRVSHALIVLGGGARRAENGFDFDVHRGG